MNQSAPKNIIEGFEEDFEHIRLKFIKRSPKLRLEDFYTFWKDAQIDCLFANRFDPRELLEMITEVNKVLVYKALYKQNDLTARLVALYFVLCIGAKQPERLRRRIRTTCEDVVEVARLCADVTRVYSHNDAKTSWKLLIEMEAIEVVEKRLAYGPSMLDHRKSSNRPHHHIERSTESSTEADASNDDKADLHRIESTLNELECLGGDYNYLRGLLNLNEVNDATVDVESTATVREHLDHAMSLLQEYKD